VEKLQRKLFSQNFLHNRHLASRLIRSSSVGKNDLVIEIGPGKGILTEQLLQCAQYVLAVEIDPHWYAYVQHRFMYAQNLTLYKADVLQFKLPSLPYKVFANIPFSIEGKIVRQLIDAQHPPKDCYLVIMKNLAYRLSGRCGENLFSLMHKPWFNFSIIHHFQKTDFTPTPNVEAVLFRFTKNEKPLLSWNERVRYQKFMKIGFGQGLPVMKNLKRVYGDKVIYAFNKLGMRNDIRPTKLLLQQWVSLYRTLTLQKVS